MRILTRFALLAPLLGAVWVSGCRTTGPERPRDALVSSARWIEVSDTLGPDPVVEALVEPYRDQLQSQMEEVIGEATGEFTKEGRGETTLGNMVADAMLDRIQGVARAPVDVAVTNSGGLRVPIPAGPVRLGTIYELMPFDNWLTVITLDGAGIDSLAQQIVRGRGEPIAGWRIRVDPATGRVLSTRADGRPIGPDDTLRVVTIDYLVAGGGRLEALWTPVSREDVPVLLRDAIADYIRQRGTIEPALDGRVRLTD